MGIRQELLNLADSMEKMASEMEAPDTVNSNDWQNYYGTLGDTDASSMDPLTRFALNG